MNNVIQKRDKIITINLKNGFIKTKNTEHILFSQYLDKNVCEVWSELKIPLTNYVVGVTYYEGDKQIFITGTLKEGEDSDSAIYRECREEFHYSPCIENIQNLLSYTENNGKTRRNWTWYHTNLSQLTYCGYIAEIQTKDTKNEKVGMIISGTYDDVSKAIDAFVPSSCTNDGIESIDFIRVDVALHAINKIHLHKSKKRKGPVWLDISSI